MAQEIAHYKFRNVTPTEVEYMALEAAIRAGLDWLALADELNRWRLASWQAGRERLSPEVVHVLRKLRLRNRQAQPDYERQRQRRRQRSRFWRSFWRSFGAELWNGNARANTFERLFDELPEGLRPAAYRALARVLHPDVGGDTDLMRQLNAAFEAFDAPDMRARTAGRPAGDEAAGREGEEATWAEKALAEIVRPA